MLVIGDRVSKDNQALKESEGLKTDRYIY